MSNLQAKIQRDCGTAIIGLIDHMAPQHDEVVDGLAHWLQTGTAPGDWCKRNDKPWQIRRHTGGYVGEVNESHPLAKDFLNALSWQY